MEKFKESFKLYKRKKPPPDYSNVIDFTKIDAEDRQVCSLILEKQSCDVLDGMIPFTSWKAYQHRKIPGFYFISNPFTPDGQRKWIKRCLNDFPLKPNITNLDVNYSDLIRERNVWSMHLDADSTDEEKQLLHKLRWSTLGYHHNWDTKKYTADRYTPFPDDLSCLSRCIAHGIGFPHFKAEAAIVNYYHLDSTLSGHTDHSEFDHISPLISISFGQTAVFLLGGLTKDIDPIALYLHSGDICIMSGECRLAYHAVPKILRTPTSELPYHEGDDDTVNGRKVEDTFEPFESYLQSSRINMNVRQVLCDGQEFPKDES
ncbi:hypothetical protein CAPTEDRAFT_191192 [Capitella teleta]|uniref:Fe2OG dioxygenase domain-containing protein n=1 Tax=Capitella teleta TaxID=283909 RepID=R7U9X0_CAPTE|nr:hypothetical protein CAPTEDRAFT_191192 [Capitella teleta]|eukprot:ELU02911.1 hypothetical protein CAPTEDRAFT_191192 [Capitella teleta]